MLNCISRSVLSVRYNTNVGVRNKVLNRNSCSNAAQIRKYYLYCFRKTLTLCGFIKQDQQLNLMEPLKACVLDHPLIFLKAKKTVYNKSIKGSSGSDSDSES